MFNLKKFEISVLLIGLVSVYDIYLTIIFSDYIESMERNLIGKYIIKQYGVYAFVLTKSITTLIVCLFCFLLKKTRYKIAVYGVLFFQIALFLFLTFFTDAKSKPLTTEETGTNPLFFFLKRLESNE